MHFFLDESGAFIPLDGQKEKVCVVGALVVPTAELPELYGEYLGLRDGLTFRDGEPKGSAQSERQLASVLELLSRRDALLEPICIDTGTHTVSDVERFRDGQAARLFLDLPEDESDATKQVVHDLRETMRGLPPQLFVQCVLYLEVVETALRHATLYFAQRRPEELGRLVWTIDGKGDRVSSVEWLWRELIGPVMSTRGSDAPFPYIAGGDYSHFSAYEMPHPSDGARTVVDLRAVFRELSFEDSRDVVGLELADLAVSALGRAMNGALGRDGWSELGDLIIHRKPQVIRFVKLSPRPEDQGVLHERYSVQSDVLQVLSGRTKSMLSEANLTKLLDDPQFDLDEFVDRN